MVKRFAITGRRRIDLFTRLADLIGDRRILTAILPQKFFLNRFRECIYVKTRFFRSLFAQQGYTASAERYYAVAADQPVARFIKNIGVYTAIDKIHPQRNVESRM